MFSLATICTTDVHLDKIGIDCNLKYTNISIVKVAEDRHVLVVNGRVELFQELLSARFYVSIRIPRDKNDNKYQTEVVRTVVDVDKFFRGAHTNIMVKYFVDSILKSTNFETKFPLRKVNEINFVEVFANA